MSVSAFFKIYSKIIIFPNSQGKKWSMRALIASRLLRLQTNKKKIKLHLELGDKFIKVLPFNYESSSLPEGINNT